MDNNNISKEYEAADPLIRKNIRHSLEHTLSVLYDLILLLIICVPVTLWTIVRWFFPLAQKDISGNLALITGGGNGLGRMVGLKLAERGCNIAIADVDMKAAEQTAADIKVTGVKSKAYRLDVSNYREIEPFYVQINEELGPVDILINNAGLIPFKSLQDDTIDNLERLIRVNINSHILMTKTFLNKMIERKKGHIVGISSMAGIYAFPWAVAYSTTKFAVTGFMSALTEQLRLQGHGNTVQTTCVMPYYIRTRKDIMDFLDARFEPIECEYAAEIIVDAILRNKNSVTVPPFLGPLIKFMCIWPIRVQQFTRDILMREADLQRKSR